jgi:hypothetical protein
MPELSSDQSDRFKRLKRFLRESMAVLLLLLPSVLLVYTFTIPKGHAEQLDFADGVNYFRVWWTWSPIGDVANNINVYIVPNNGNLQDLKCEFKFRRTPDSRMISPEGCVPFATQEGTTFRFHKPGPLDCREGDTIQFHFSTARHNIINLHAPLAYSFSAMLKVGGTPTIPEPPTDRIVDAILSTLSETKSKVVLSVVWMIVLVSTRPELGSILISLLMWVRKLQHSAGDGEDE